MGSTSDNASPNSRIPQLDGLLTTPQHQSHPSQTYQCETCLELFKYPSELLEHNEKHEYCCDECNICYETKLDADLHELELHQDAGYPDDIPPSTKRLFATGMRTKK